MVVIGGGIVGTASAYFLAKRGVSVVLLERAAIGGEQSGRNWGFVRQQGRHPLELPLAMESNRLWQTLESELQADLEWTVGGNLALAADTARLGQYEQWLDVARKHALDTRLLTAEEVRTLIPGLQGPVAGGMFTPSDGHADPVKTTEAFAQAARRAGATVVSGCAVDRIVATDGAVSGVIAQDREIATQRVVCATGAWSARLVSALGLTLPQRFFRGTVQRTVPLGAITRAGVWAGPFSFRQRRDGRVILAGSRVDYDLRLNSLRRLWRFLPNYWRNRGLFRLRVGSPLLRDLVDSMGWSSRSRHPFRSRYAVEPAPNQRDARHTLQTFHRWLPTVGQVQSEKQWAGIIEATPDALPIIDAPGRPAGLVVATGFSGHGFAMGPMAGRLVSELIVDGTPSLDLHPFRFARFAEGALAAPRAVL